MYSAAKAALEREKNTPHNTAVSSLNEAELQGKAKALNDIIHILTPLLDAKLKAAQEIDAMQDTIHNLTVMLESVKVSVKNIEVSKNVNAELEREVLTKINGLL